jgi:hypothetical protein
LGFYSIDLAQVKVSEVNEKRKRCSTGLAATLTGASQRTIRRYAIEGRIKARQKGNSYWEVILVFRGEEYWDFEWLPKYTRPTRPNTLA